MTLSRRQVLTGLSQSLAGLITGGIATRISTPASAAASNSALILGNGLRVHLAPNKSGYISAGLVLRSQHINDPRGLAHIMEHTSFTGAAGSMTAAQIKAMREDCVQESNATTGIGMINWSASFLPRNASQVMELLATTSLDQKFDEDTVASEARVVLQELYLDKYEAEGRAKKFYNSALYGSSHPYARDTTDTEIATARLPASTLAAELGQYAQLLKLPANMDLFLAGEFDPGEMTALIHRSFGRFEFAQGPILDLPHVEATRDYKALSASSKEFTRPLSENRIAWSTGVRITDSEAGALLALGEYLNKVLFKEIREKSGDAYSPEAVFNADSCSGVFEIKIRSSTKPDAVEHKIFKTLASLRTDIDEKELRRISNKFELQRLKIAQSNDEILTYMQDRVLHGCSSRDFQVKSIAAADIKTVARRFLPSYKGAYVRLAMLGQ